MFSRKMKGHYMPEKLQNILWMGEELDFNLDPVAKEEAKASIKSFLELTSNPAFSHWLYRAYR